jgi:hypothetical protein
MTTKSTRSKSHRRDRRRAKASDWNRPGKTGMGGRVGHGPGPAPQVTVNSDVEVVAETVPEDIKEPRLKVPLMKLDKDKALGDPVVVNKKIKRKKQREKQKVRPKTMPEPTLTASLGDYLSKVT